MANPLPRVGGTAGVHPGGTALPGCLTTLDQPAWGSAPPPWAPGRREQPGTVNRIAEYPDKLWCLAEVGIFRDLSPTDMDHLAALLPMRTYPAGALLFAPPSPVETLFILKAGRVRLFRISTDGRALTTSILGAGTIFGEMVLLGQHMYDNYAEALDDVTVCVVSRTCVANNLMSDPRIATRVAQILGQRLLDMEQRLSDNVFKNVPQRVAGMLLRIATSTPRRGLPGRRGGDREEQVRLTHEQLAALVGTTRETVTKVLGEYAEQGLVRLGRGRVTILDGTRLAEEANG